MKHVLLFFAVFPALFLHGQNNLTFGQVYNYDVGDVIQGMLSNSYNNASGPPVYRSDIFLSKTLSPNNDTIVYSIQRFHYTPPACPSCAAVVSTNTISQVVTNLNTTIPNSNSTTCYTTADTLYMDHCNRKTYKIYPVYKSGCFEPNTETSEYIEGVGYFYDKYFANAPTSGYKYTLLYYQKQSGSCGNQIFTGIEEKSNNIILSSLFPNPCKDIIHLNAGTELYDYLIFDNNGELKQSGFISNQQVNVSGLLPGNYLLQVHTRDSKVSTSKFIRE